LSVPKKNNLISQSNFLSKDDVNDILDIRTIFIFVAAVGFGCSTDGWLYVVSTEVSVPVKIQTKPI